MGVTERKEREKEQRQKSILDAATAVFMEKGIVPATMNEVAERAELAKGTLYLYYQNKEDLTAALTARGMEILENKFRRVMKSNKSGMEKVISCGEAYFDFFKTYPLYAELLVNFSSRKFSEDERTPNIQCCHELGQQALGIFIEAIVTGIQDGTIRKTIDPVKTALLLWSSSHGVAMLIKNQGELIEEVTGVKKKTFMEYFFTFMQSAMEK
jgi:TetR/AcrR family transcriptional regulator